MAMDYSLCNRGLSESVGSGCPVVRNSVIQPRRSSMTRPYDSGWCERGKAMIATNKIEIMYVLVFLHPAFDCVHDKPHGGNLYRGARYRDKHEDTRIGGRGSLVNGAA